MNNEKFTPKTLSEFYAACPFEGASPHVLDLYDGVFIPALGPCVGSEISRWSWPEPKPQKKVIDMTILVGSGIDCEFSDNTKNGWYVGGLTGISKDGEYPYADKFGASWKFCRPRLNHWVAHDGEYCKLPEGLSIIVRRADGSETRHTTDDHPGRYGWEWGVLINERSIIAYKILGPADGWRFEWEKEE